MQVREKRAELEKLKSTFVRRASEFLRNYFASLVDFMINDKSYFSQVTLLLHYFSSFAISNELMLYLMSSGYLQRGQLKRPDHADLRYKCRTYARLLQHLKVPTHLKSRTLN